MWLDTFGDPEGEVVFYIFCGVSGLILILSVLNLILGCCIARNSVSVSCDYHIEIGCLCLAATVLIRGFNQEWAEENALNILGKIYHVILLIGLTQFIGGLFVKGWTMFLFYKYNSEKKPLSEEWIPNLLIWILILIAVAASMVWEFLFQPEYGMEDGEMKCIYTSQFEWYIGTSAWHALLLVLALVSVPASCAATRRTHGAREANVLGIVVVNTVLCVVAGICMWFLYFNGDRFEIEDDMKTDEIQYAILGGLMLWMCLFADMMFLISKCCHACGGGSSHDHGGDNYDTIDAGSDHNSYVHQNPSYDTAGAKTNDTFEY